MSKVGDAEAARYRSGQPMRLTSPASA